MRITLYKTLFDKTERTPCLVKETATNYGGETLNNPCAIARMLRDVFQHDLETEEVVYLLCFDTKYKPIGVFQLSKGTVGLSCINPREVYMKALLCGAVTIVVAHNHPSGDPTPSTSDIDSTQRTLEAGKMLGVKLTDSIIIGNNEYYSFQEEGRL